jgi:hypothetical protein
LSRIANGRRGIIGLALAMLIMTAVGAQPAHAGTWMQVSCVNPDGSAAPSEGWAQSASGPVDGGATASAQCSPGAPMVAALSVLSAAPAGSTELLTYQPPAGSALVGGSVDVNMSADGTGSDANGAAVARSELFEPVVSSSPFFQCVAGFKLCSASAPDYSGLVNLPADAQGDLIALVTCQANDGTAPCDATPNNNVWAQVQVVWARLLLSSSVSPAGSGFGGSALQPGARGTAHLVFTAAESSGPGIYTYSVAIDGQTVSSGSPNANGGRCVPVGTDPGTGALMFDYQQPCLTSEVVDVPVPTAAVPDGSHELTVTLTDAAGNSSTVFDQNITTSNPQTTPRPGGRGALHAQFTISWRWSAATTVLRSIGVRGLPRNARVRVRCVGKHCPRLGFAAKGPRKVKARLRRLGGRHLLAGQTLLITVTAPHHRAERIALDILDGRKPSARLLSH